MSEQAENPFVKQALPQLFAGKANVLAELEKGKAILSQIDQAIGLLAGPMALEAFERAGKKDGTVRFAIENRIYKAEIRKTVSWDTDKLLGVSASLPFEKSKELFKTELSVPEKAFGSIDNDDLKAKLIAARTVKYSDPKITEAEPEK